MQADTACFTGHRPGKLPWGSDEDSPACRMMKLRLISAAFKACDDGFCRFISGMADGVDLIAAEAVLKLKEARPGVSLECALPYPGAGRNSRNRDRYDRVLAAADRVEVIAQSYSPGCLMRRNRYMVDNSARVIAVYGGGPGGTRATLDYAHKLGREVVLIDLRPKGNSENCGD